MDAGDVVLSSSKSGFIETCIKWFTNSKFSHSFIAMPDLLSFPMCIEAVSGGVQMTRFDSSYENNQDVGYEIWQVNLPKDIKKAALQNIINDLEISYNFLAYPWFMWRKLNSLVGRDIRNQNNWLAHNGMICSYLVIAYLKAAGLQSALVGYGDGSINPQDIRNIMIAHPQLFTLIQSVRLTI